MEDPTHLTDEDLRELAAFLERELAQCQTQIETDELRLRLARLYLGTLQDPARAAVHTEELLGQIEPLVVKDLGDDDLRQRYIELAKSVRAELRAAETLGRAIKRTKGNTVRERVGFEVATLYLQEGELKQARGAFLEVVLADAGGPRALAAARRLLDLEGEPGDPQVIGTALEMIAKIAPDLADRQDAATRLLSMHESKPLKESRLAVAFQALVDSPRADEALAWLHTFHERKGDKKSLSGVYRRQALRASDPALARSLALRSIELSSVGSDAERIEQWLWFIKDYGPHHPAHAELIPLLEQAQRWDDLCRVLEADVEFAAPEERAALIVRLGQTRLTRLGDTDGALAAFGRCLSLEPSSDVARGAVEGLMAEGDRRLAAAEILEPFYRDAQSHEGELRVLETRAELLADPGSRLSALTAAVDIAMDRLADPDRALALCRRAVEADPSSPELLRRLDELLQGKEAPAERLARYDAGLQGTAAPGRRSSLMHTIAAIKRDTLDDPAGAVDVLRGILTEDPTDHAAYDALIEAIEKRGDTDGALALIDSARESLRGHERNRMTLRKARALARRGATDRALDLCRELIAEGDLHPSVLQAIVEIAHEEDDPTLHRRALELLIAGSDPDAKRDALERFGHFVFETLGDRRAAVESWKAAAHLCDDSPAGQEHARMLYERVLDTWSDDAEARQELAELYIRSGDWSKIPDALRVLIRVEQDLGRCVLLLLRLEESAVLARALDEFVSLVDELIDRLPRDSPEQIRALTRARARALASDSARQADASKAYRELIESFESEDDVCDFVAFAESRPGADERHQDRRWLYQWRAAHNARPAEVLMEWARAEEEYGEPAAAIAVYERLAEADVGRKVAQEALCRLKFHAGDVAGGLAAYRALREDHDDQERVALDLRTARLLLEEMDRPVEAAVVLAPTLAMSPPIREAHELAAQMLADPTASDEVGARFAQIANTVDDLPALHIFDFLVAAPTVSGARHRWLQRIIELAPADPAIALSAVVRGAMDLPDAISLWEGAERIARNLGQPEVVARAYRRVLVERVVGAALAEVLGRRMVAFEEECAIESSQSIEALLRILELAPGARWALDRVKLVLGSQARFGELFGLFDRAIDAAPDERQRGDLLSEAAFAARDLAGEPQRAIAYLESLHALRADDGAVEGALERLYERHERKVDLIDLLSKRLDRASGFKRRDLGRRIASLWLDLGDMERAGAVVEQMLSGDATVADVIDLLERILMRPAPESHSGRRRGPEPAAVVQERAIELLRGHYEGAGRVEDVVRVAERSFALAREAGKRARSIRDLVGLRLRAAAGGPRVFAQVIARIESDLAGDPKLTSIAYKALLLHAISALKRAPASARADAEDGAWQAIQELVALLTDPAKAEAAFRLLYRCSHLPFERSRKRDLLCAAALVCSQRLRDPVRAIRLFGELFDEDAGDDIAGKCLDGFSQLLDAAGQHAKLARLWEEQARIRKSMSAAEQRACWQRAADLWERQAAWDQAVGAYRRGAALGSEASFEALARIHASRREWADAAKALEWLCAHSPAKGRGLRALRLAEVYVELDQRDHSRACLEDALRTPAEDMDQVRERLIALYRQDEVWRPLARLLAAEARRVGDPQRKLELLREASDLYRRRLDEPAEAAALLELAVSLDPLDGVLRASLVDVLEALERWDQAAAVLGAQIELFGDHRSKDRAVVHRRLARALVRANRPEDALAALRLALEMHPAHSAILYDLARVALDLGQLELAERTYRALLLVVHRPTEDLSTAPPPRADVFVDLSEVALRKGDAARATDLVDSAFDEAVEHGEDPGRLEHGLRARGRHDLLSRALERRVQRGATLTERAIALGDLVALWTEHLGRPSELGTRIRQHGERIARDLDHEDLADASAWAALSTVYTSFRDGDGTPSARPRGQRPAGRLGKGDLAALLEAAIPKAKPGADRSRLRVIRARTLLEQDLEAAIVELSNALAEDPAGREATELLSEVLGRQGRNDELVTALERRLLLLSSDGNASDVVDAAWRLGQALERAGRAKDALPVYESVLDRQPNDSEIVRALAGRLEELGSARVADCLERWMTVDVGATSGVAKQLVELREGQGDRAGAVRALEAWFSADPANNECRDRLVKSYEDQAEWGQAARVLCRAADAAPEDRPLFLRLIEAYRRAGSDREALRALDVAVTARPGDAELLSLRANARERVSDHEGAISDLESASVANSAYVNALIELLSRIASVADSSDADANTIRLADTLIRLKRPKQARRELERLLGRSPNHVEGLTRVATLAADDGNWDSAAGAYRQLLLIVAKGSNREELARVAIATADACERAGGLGEVREPLERALEILSQSAGLIPDVERLCRAMKDWERLASMLVARAERQENAEEKAELLLRAGRILLEEARDPASALRVIELVGMTRPESVEALLLWARAQVALGRAHQALSALYDAAERNRGKRSPVLASIYLEMGKAHLAVDELVEAFNALESGFSVDWRTGDIAMLLGLVALDLDEERAAERALSSVTTLPPRKEASGPGADAATKAVAFYHLASIALAKGDLAKARRLASKAVGGDPGHMPARALLEKLDSQTVAMGAPGK